MLSVDGGQPDTPVMAVPARPMVTSLLKGRFTVLAIACRDELDCPVPDDLELGIAQCSGETPASRSARRRVAQTNQYFVLYTSDDPQECRTIPDFGCGIIDNDGNGVSDGWVS